MRVAELMTTEVQTIDPEAPLDEALTLMAEGHLSALPVVNVHRRLVGVLSAADVLQALTDHGDADGRARVLDGTVADLMTPRPAAVTLDTTVKEAAQQLLYLEVHRLFVTDGERLVGVISQTDIVRGVAVASL